MIEKKVSGKSADPPLFFFSFFCIPQGKIDLFRQNNELSYRLKDTSSAGKIKGADVEEKVVYKIVEESGNKGIWARDIRFKSNLSLTQLNKILKALEGKKLIKAVNSVAVRIHRVVLPNTVIGSNVCFFLQH